MNNSGPPLAEENLGLVRLCANKFRGRGIEYEELYSAGCVGLIKAAKAFDSQRGVKFSTYAVPVILGEIKRLFRDGGTVKVSRSIKELSIKITKTREEFLLKNSREPTVSELSQLCGSSEEAVIEALNSSLPAISLTSFCDDEQSGQQIDIPVESIDEDIADKIALRQAINSLEPNDRKLIYLRYFQNKTQVETAKILNMTQVQVSRREKKILAVMKTKLI